MQFRAYLNLIFVKRPFLSVLPHDPYNLFYSKRIEVYSGKFRTFLQRTPICWALSIRALLIYEYAKLVSSLYGYHYFKATQQVKRSRLGCNASFLLMNGKDREFLVDYLNYNDFAIKIKVV